MNKYLKLSDVAYYVKSRISINDVDLDNYVTTDNLLQNKLGVERAVGLPPQGGLVPAYKKGDILVANIRPYLKKIWYASKSGGCSADVLILRPKEGYDSKFIYYALFRDDFFHHVMKGSKGTKMPRGDKNQIMEFTIPDFDYCTQKKIGTVLSNFDAKIGINNQINQELESLAKLIYDYWFVQFDFPISPKQAQAMGNPELKDKPYRSSDGPMVYNEKLKREIPEGWEVKDLGQVLTTALGGTPSTLVNEFWENGEHPWLNSGEIANFPIISSELKITEEAIINSATKLMPKGTVLLSITRHIRPSVLAIDACANQSVVGIFENEELKCSYIYPFIQCQIPRYMSLRTGAQQPHINKKTIDDTKFVLPQKEVLSKFYQFVEPIYESINNKTFQNKQLSELRDWLLPMLMNGQVKVDGSIFDGNLNMETEPEESYGA